MVEVPEFSRGMGGRYVRDQAHPTVEVRQRTWYDLHITVHVMFQYGLVLTFIVFNALDYMPSTKDAFRYSGIG